MKRKRILAWMAGAAIVTAVLLAWKTAGKPDGKQPVYETVPVLTGEISSYVTATGSIEPVTEVTVGTQVSGIVAKLYADYNSVVRKGQLIAEMDKVTLESELASAEAAYEGNEAEYRYRSANYERTNRLHEKGLVSDTEYELALYNFKMAESAWHSSEATLAKARRNLSYATITSPIDGIVIDRAVEEGQTVAAGFETPTLFTIAADLTRMQVVADVDEADIGGVREGQRVSFTVDAWPGDLFEGKVTQIRLGSSSNTSGTESSESVVTYEVVISADNPDLKLLPRLTANVNIYTVDRTDVLCVPSKALRFSPEIPLVGEDAVIRDCESEEKLWTRQGNIFTAIPVRTGISNGTTTEILEGIEPGTEVILDAVFPAEKKTRESIAQNTERSPFMPGPPGTDKAEKRNSAGGTKQ